MKTSVQVFIAFVMLLSVRIQYAQAKIVFKPLQDMNSYRYGMGYTTDGENIYSVCGSSFMDLLNSIEKYDVINNKWIILSESLTPKRYCNAEYISANNKIYIFNGEYYPAGKRKVFGNIEIFDLNTNQLSGSFDNPYPTRYAGSAVWNNKIYIFGGMVLDEFMSNLDRYSNHFYEFDPIKLTWKRLPNLLETKQTSGRIVEGILYIFGGYNGQTLESIEAYNIEDSTWTNLGRLSEGISAHATASDGKNIWLVGSYRNTKFIAAYDTKSKSLTKFNSTMTERRHAGAQVIGNSLYVFGGNQNKQSTTTLSNTESADISFFIK